MATTSPKTATDTRTASMTGVVEEDSGLAALFLHGIKDIYYAEKKLTKALPKMIKAAKAPDLVKALTDHLEETEEHVTKVERIFESLDETPKAVKCEAIEGIVTEAEEILKEFGKTGAGDAAIIFAGQAAEHYEITRYGSLRAFAEILRYGEAEKLIESILKQEKAADETLTKIAEDRVDWAAAHTKDTSKEGSLWRFWN